MVTWKNAWTVHRTLGPDRTTVRRERVVPRPTSVTGFTPPLLLLSDCPFLSDYLLYIITCEISLFLLSSKFVSFPFRFSCSIIPYFLRTFLHVIIYGRVGTISSRYFHRLSFTRDSSGGPPLGSSCCFFLAYYCLAYWSNGLGILSAEVSPVSNIIEGWVAFWAFAVQGWILSEVQYYTPERILTWT